MSELDAFIAVDAAFRAVDGLCRAILRFQEIDRRELRVPRLPNEPRLHQRAIDEAWRRVEDCVSGLRDAITPCLDSAVREYGHAPAGAWGVDFMSEAREVRGARLSEVMEMMLSRRDRLHTLVSLLRPRGQIASRTTPDAQAAKGPEKEEAQEPEIVKWSKPRSITKWAKVFGGVHRNTMRKRFEAQNPRNKKSGQLYQVAVEDIPAGSADLG